MSVRLDQWIGELPVARQEGHNLIWILQVWRSRCGHISYTKLLATPVLLPL